jgi:hypothetical protein
MSTPPRMVELKCPKCRHRHWEIDYDFRGLSLSGGRDLPYEDRSYVCPGCREAATGYRVLRRSPPAFFLQPHPMYPMSTARFARWLAMCRTQFPSHPRLKSVGVFWYPGKSQAQREKLHEACHIGVVGDYRLSLSNDGPEEERIRVCVQGRKAGEAHFWCSPDVVLDHCYFGFESGELDTIRELLAGRTMDIQRAWERFSQAAREAQERWQQKLSGSERRSWWRSLNQWSGVQ